MADTLVREQLLTAKEFWDRYAGSDERVELVDGKVVTMSPVGPLHGEVDGEFSNLLIPFVKKRRLGKVYLNTGFILRHSPDKVRGPDQAFVSAERIKTNPPPEEGFWPIVPDLVVEIVSPGDTAQEVNDKVMDYLDGGVRLCWVIYPRRRQVHVFRGGERPEIIAADGVLNGADVLPGFQLQLTELWASDPEP